LIEILASRLPVRSPSSFKRFDGSKPMAKAVTEPADELGHRRPVPLNPIDQRVDAVPREGEPENGHPSVRSRRSRIGGPARCSAPKAANGFRFRSPGMERTVTPLKALLSDTFPHRRDDGPGRTLLCRRMAKAHSARMRIVSHASPAVIEQVVAALTDVLATSTEPAPSPGRSGGWKGEAVEKDDELVLVATRRSAQARRNIRIAAALNPSPNGRGGHDRVHDSLRSLIGALSQTDAPDRRDELPDELRDAVVYELMQRPELIGWRTAMIRPASKTGATTIVVRMEDGRKVPMASGRGSGEAIEMGEDLTRLLSHHADAQHLEAFATGNDLFVRIGPAPWLGADAPGPLEALRIGAQLNRDRSPS
jgi:hypothetical protein